ncbi:MAG: arsenate reductase ArsC [Desulfotalea sp.]
MKKVLFLCTGNSCRSQMAEGLVRHLLKDEVEAYSAGIEVHGLNDSAILVMAEIGIDISTHLSKNIDAFSDLTFDLVVTVCDHAHKTCPFFPGRTIHVGFPDPPKMAKELAEQGANQEDQLNCYRQVRDQIKDFVKTLPDLLI